MKASYFKPFLGLLALTANAAATLSVYEGFDYPAGGNLPGSNGGDGFGGSWTSTTSAANAPDFILQANSIDYPNLVTAGGHVARPSRTGIVSNSRTLAAASVSELTGDGTTLWGSFLYRHGNGDGFLADSSLNLASTTTSSSNNHQLSAAGFGVGVLIGENNDDVEAIFYDNNILANESATTALTAVSNTTSFFVFSIEWNPDGTDDVLSVYRVTDVDGPLPAPFSVVNFDFSAAEQASLSILNVVETQTGEFDEIRLGTTREDVTPFEDIVDPPDPVISDGPNVIYIITDDMGYSDVGAYGGEIDTPHIDSLAADGMSFRQYYNNAKCEPTRTSVMTGLYHGRGDGNGNNTRGGATLAEAVKTVGYQTYAVGKWHLGAGSLIPVRQGFDHFYGFYSGGTDYFPGGISATEMKRDAAVDGDYLSTYPDTHFNTQSGITSHQTTFVNGYYQTDALGDNAVTFIEDSVQNHPERPFFLYLAFNAPHTPLQAPVPLIEKYRGTYMEGWDVLRQEKWERQKALGLIDPEWQLPHLRDDIPQWSSLTAAEKEREDHRRSVYSAMMDSLDQNVGKVLAALETLGIEDDTLVIFTGDNGAQAFDNTNDRNSSPSQEDSRWSMGPAWAAFSNTPFRYYKQSQHQGGICTPFIARWPGVIEPGSMTDQPGHIVDVMATLVDVSGADYDSLTKDDGNPVPPMDGASLMPILEGGSRPGPDFWGFEFGASEFGVIQGDWKLAAFSSSPWRLYNLKTDRTETKNLRWEYPAKVAELAALYDQWAVDTYGNNSRTYAERDLRNQLSQELRYTKVLGGGLFQQPGVDITLSNIGSGANATINDHWEFYLTATSASGLATASDSVTFANKPFCGDGFVGAQVEVLSNLATGGSAGVMLRESIAIDSALLSLALNGSGELIQSMRAASGQNVASTTVATGLTTPLFVRITREGNTFTPAYSADNATWTNLTNVSLNLPLDLLAGLAAASGNNGTRASITFREWETRHVGTYPLSLRNDGLPEYMAFAFGVSPDGNSTAALPEMQIAESNGNQYPELHFQRRLGLDPNAFIVRWWGDDFSLFKDDTNGWQTTTTTPNPDGLTESVQLRRNTEIGEESGAFYSLEVAPK